MLFFCVLTVGVHSLLAGDDRIQWLTTPAMWGFALMLALVPTVISLIMMVIAVHLIGSAPTAIMGALEPLTAVILIIAGRSFSISRIRLALAHAKGKRFRR